MHLKLQEAVKAGNEVFQKKEAERRARQDKAAREHGIAIDKWFTSTLFALIQRQTQRGLSSLKIIRTPYRDTTSFSFHLINEDARGGIELLDSPKNRVILEHQVREIEGLTLTWEADGPRISWEISCASVGSDT
jgi:hypothetical protein